MARKKTPDSFDAVLGKLADLGQPFSPRNLYLFSDLDREQSDALEAAWPALPRARRLALVEDLSELADANVEVNPEAVFRVALDDEDGEVRAEAMGGLWESESPDLPGMFFNVLKEDPDHRARAAAAHALGRYVHEAEMEQLDARVGRRLEEALLKVATGSDHEEVRHRALESLGFSSRGEVPPLITAAYASPDEATRACALLAMAHSADQRWREPVLAELSSLSPKIRLEAARAAGALELKAAVPALIEDLQDTEADVRWEAIWALGQIGGKPARAALEELLRDADEDEAEHIEVMLDNLEFVDGVNDFLVINLDEDDDGEGDALDLLDELDDDDPESLLN